MSHYIKDSYSIQQSGEWRSLFVEFVYEFVQAPDQNKHPEYYMYKRQMEQHRSEGMSQECTNAGWWCRAEPW